MAVQPVTKPNHSKGDIIINDTLLINWELGNGDVGQAWKGGNFNDQSVHAYGVFGASGVAELRGSNMEEPDPENNDHWFTLRAAHDGQEIAPSSNYGAVILENVLWISPRCTAGDGSTLINFSIKSNKRK